MVGRIGVAVSGADSNRVYALVENENGGLFASDDAGATWTLINAARSIRQRAFYYTHVAADPNNKDTVYLLNTSAFRSTDGGKTLSNIGQGTHGDHHDLWIDPDNSEHVIIGNDGGGAITYRVSVARPTWSDQDFPTAQFYHVTTTAHLPFHVCGAQQDNSTLCVASDTGLGGGFGRIPPVEPYQAGGGEPGYIAADPRNPDVFFAGANNGSFLTRLNRRTGELKEVGAYPRFFSGEPSKDVKERWQWTYPIIFSYVDPNVLYTSSQRVWKSTNGGDTLGRDQRRPLAPRSQDDAGVGRTDHARHEQPGDLRRRCSRWRPGNKDINMLWAGSDDGLVQVTRDGGKTLDQHHAARHAGSRPRQPDRRLVLRQRHRLRRGEEDAARRRVAVHLPTRDFGKSVDEDRQRHRRQRLRARRPRRHEAQGAALRRHAARRLRVVRRRRAVAAVQERAAGHAGERLVGGGQRARDRHPRPQLLRDGQPRDAAPVRPRRR